MSSKREDDIPRQTVCSLSVTPQHLADLKSLEKNGEFITPEHPNLIRRYFRGIAISFEALDHELVSDISAIKHTSTSDIKRGYQSDVRLWRVSLIEGAKILVKRKPTRSPPRFDGNKIVGQFHVSIEQEVSCIPHSHKEKCIFCGALVDNLDYHIINNCKSRDNRK